MTQGQTIAKHLLHYLTTPTARSTASIFGVEAIEACGDIYLRLLRQAPPKIRDVQKWVHANAKYHLRHYLIRDAHARLHPLQAEEQMP